MSTIASPVVESNPERQRKAAVARARRIARRHNMRIVTRSERNGGPRYEVQAAIPVSGVLDLTLNELLEFLRLADCPNMVQTTPCQNINPSLKTAHIGSQRENFGGVGMRMNLHCTFDDGGRVINIRTQTLCTGCGKEIDETKRITKFPGATLKEQAEAEVIAYARFFEEVGFGDLRYWHGDCWRADLTNMPQDTDMPEPEQYVLPFLCEGKG